MEPKIFPSANSATTTRLLRGYGANLDEASKLSMPLEALNGASTRPLSDAQIAAFPDCMARVLSEGNSAVPGGYQPSAAYRIGMIREGLWTHLSLIDEWKESLSASDRWQPILPLAKTDEEALMMVAATLKPIRRDRDQHRARFLTMDAPSDWASHNWPSRNPSDEEPLGFGEKELTNAIPRTAGQAWKLISASYIYVSAKRPPDWLAREHKWTRKVVEAHLEPEFALLPAWRKMHPDWKPRLPLPLTDVQAVMAVVAILQPSDEDKELNRQFLAEGAKS